MKTRIITMIRVLVMVQLSLTFNLHSAHANCLRDFTSSPQSSALGKRALAWGIAYPVLIATTGLLAWGAYAAGSYAAEMSAKGAAQTCSYSYSTYLANHNITAQYTVTGCFLDGTMYDDQYNHYYQIDACKTPAGNFYDCADSYPCEPEIRSCVHYMRQRSGYIAASLFSSLGTVGGFLADFCLASNAYRGVADYFTHRKTWQKNRKYIGSVCGVGLKVTATDPLAALYESVLPRDEEKPLLTPMDVLLNIAIYGNELNGLCPDGNFVGEREFEEWLKLRQVISVRDFLRIRGTLDSYPKEFIMQKALLHVMRPFSIRVRDAVLARNKAKNALSGIASQIEAHENELKEKQEQADKAAKELSAARTERDNAEALLAKTNECDPAFGTRRKVFDLTSRVLNQIEVQHTALGEWLAAIREQIAVLNSELSLKSDNLAKAEKVRIDAYAEFNAALKRYQAAPDSPELGHHMERFKLKLRQRDMRAAGAQGEELRYDSDGSDDEKKEETRTGVTPEEGAETAHVIPPPAWDSDISLVIAEPTPAADVTRAAAAATAVSTPRPSDAGFGLGIR
jgi:hypothetical protein